jgi:hypothetical protein
MPIHRTINRTPLRDALLLAGHDNVDGRMLYQDYLNIVAGQGLGRDAVPPMSEEQWEIMCDILGSDRPLYASTVSAMIRLDQRRQSRKVDSVR